MPAWASMLRSIGNQWPSPAAAPPWSTRTGISGPAFRFSSKSGFTEPERAVADR